MPYSSGRKQLLHNVELTIPLAHFDDDDDTVEKIVDFHAVLSAFPFVHE